VGVCYTTASSNNQQQRIGRPQGDVMSTIDIFIAIIDILGNLARISSGSGRVVKGQIDSVVYTIMSWETLKAQMDFL
jgi:hypothetical protein